LIRETADAFVSSGFADHGYTYICIDDGWEVPTPGRGIKETPERGIKGELGVQGTPRRDEQGNILTNAHFPNMKALADYIHAKGMKFGISSSPGPTTCQGVEASAGHEEQDLKTGASWGVDYVKYDWCSYQIPGAGRRGGRGGNQNIPGLKAPYQVLRAAIDKQDRDMVMSMCQYGMGNSWEWAAEDGIGANLWRSTGDIRDNWPNVSNIGFAQNGHEMFTKPGHWNDTDMLVVGVVGWSYEEPHASKLTQNEQLTHIGLWAILAAPMILGNDMTKMDEFTAAMMCNDEMLAVDQDPLGKQGKRILPASPEGQPNAGARAPQQVWARELWDGTMAVGLFNLGDAPAKVSVSLKELNEGLKMKVEAGVPVRDIWGLKDLAGAGEVVEAEVPRHGMVFLKVGKGKSEAECVAALVKANGG
ncbi:MAG TPA: glycoside hydrolase family 27 protein, partial [Phycisphaerae bacterium]|nr:glycoside hydrolase family 27 protein [Phycisphaerae bacterium]